MSSSCSPTTIRQMWLPMPVKRPVSSRLCSTCHPVGQRMESAGWQRSRAGKKRSRTPWQKQSTMPASSVARACMSWRASPDENTPESQVAETFVGNLLRASEAAAPHGIDMLIEPINSRDIPGYYLNYVEEAAAIIVGIGAPNLKLQFDIYHRQIMSGDVSVSLATYLPLVGHIQTASVPDRNEPMSGELNDWAVFDLLDELGYAGWIGCEYRPKAGTVEGLDWIARGR